MAEQHTDDTAREHESRMAKAIMRDISVAVPVALVVLFGAIMWFTEKSIGDAIATTLLPGVLIGVFFGGFSGTARTMD